MREDANSDTAKSLCAEAQRFVGAHLEPKNWLAGGDEALVLQANTEKLSLVIHASPAWRASSVLSWCHDVAKHASRELPQVVLPLQRGGRTIFNWKTYRVAVFPFVDGEMLDRENAHLRAQAATLLAQIHLALEDWPGDARPTSEQPQAMSEQRQPGELVDSTLDAQWSEINAREFKTSVTHGDYYRRNILCKGDKIVGIIDWHDASVRLTSIEVAGATFELCKNNEHDLVFERANHFVDCYSKANGPVPAYELRSLLPLIRVWIRNDVVHCLACGVDPNDEYVQKQIRSFHRLSSCVWSPPL